MWTPDRIRDLSLPMIAAPMFLASSVSSVVAAARSGIVGAIPALNARTTESFERVLVDIKEGLTAGPFAGVKAIGPYAINLVVHKSNARLEADLDMIVKHRVPIVITSLGAVRNVVDKIHGYGGVVFHDVISTYHAQKALDAGVDGIIAVCAGAGGHAGTLNPFAFLHELRALTDRTLILAGAISTGRHVAAAILAGADMVSVGTRFIATRESPVPDAFKTMIVESHAGDIVYTPKISGVNANFLTKSIAAAGISLETFEGHSALDMASELSSGKAWRDIWSAGHGVGAITDIPSIEELVRRMRAEYAQAVRELPHFD